MDPWVYGAGETRAYIAQTGKWPKINSITINLDETKWDRIPPMSRTFLGGVRGPPLPPEAPGLEGLGGEEPPGRPGVLGNE